MSRLIVKNLPPKITEDKLLKTFSAHGLVTDVQLKFSKDGKFRQFAFVGFKSEEEAKKAQSYLDSTFIGASKIKVEISADLGDANKPRPWSKHAEDNSTKKKSEPVEQPESKTKKKKKDEKSKVKKVAQLMEKYKGDEKFKEFLRIHKRNSFEEWNLDAILNVGKQFEKQEGDGLDGDVHHESVEGGTDHDDVVETEEKVALKDSVSDLDYLKSMMACQEKTSSSDEPMDTSLDKVDKKAKEKSTKKREPKNETFFEVKLSNLPFKAKKKDVKAFLKPLKPKSIRVPRNIKGIAYAGFATEEQQKSALKKSKSFIKDKQILVTIFLNRSDHKEREQRWKDQEQAVAQDETVAESGRIFIRNLTYTVTEEDLEKLFKPFGPLTEMHLPIDKFTRKPKGFAFVTFVLPENAVTAFSKLDGTTYQGRLLHLIPAKAKESEETAEGGDQGGSAYKAEKAKKEKASAGSSHNWNTLFLGSSVVADLVADKYGVSKHDVLTGEGHQSAAVRLALGETQIVTETRSFLEEEGISLDAFSRPPTSRSKTVILVKNLPAFTKVEEIRDLFARHGQLGRVVLPRSGVTAVVEFYEPSEARVAFRNLAYTKFHQVPLYLEWAPDGAFREGPGPKPDKVEDVLEAEDAKKVVQSTSAPEQPLGDPEPNTTLFVKNLNFDTTENSLREHFSKIGPLYSATIATKKDVKRQGLVLSMGYGFVQFMHASSVDKALKLLQHKMLDEHCLELKRSSRDSTTNEASSKKTVVRPEEASCKIICRNVPFEATEKEVRDVFKTFGTLKSVRLPKKVTGSHRGFAFVEFLTKEEAKRAFEALCHSTHLYGRRLVLEWAAEEDTLETLRAKTAQQFNVGAQPPAKRLKKSAILEALGVTNEEM